MLLRQSAWSTMLGIDYEQFADFERMYHEVLAANPPSEDDGKEYIRQIKLDVARTFRPWNLKFLSSDINKGHNKLYNVLKVYALALDPDLGYTQGMNFVAAVILMHVPNEALACKIFMNLLEKDKWS